MFCAWDRVVCLFPVTAIDNKTSLINATTTTDKDYACRMSLVHENWTLVNHVNLLYSKSPVYQEFRPATRSANDSLCAVMLLARGPDHDIEDEKWNMYLWRMDYCHHYELKMLYEIATSNKPYGDGVQFTNYFSPVRGLICSTNFCSYSILQTASFSVRCVCDTTQEVVRGAILRRIC